MPSIIDTFKEFVEKDPDNAFARYSLAMVHKSASEFDVAREQFETLMERHPDYLPAYYQAAQNYEALDEIDLARATYERGIEVAEEQGDSHTASEAREALEMLD